LCDLLETYLVPAQIDDIHRAYLFGARAHSGQFRLTGDPYITHPLAVAHVLAEMHMDPHSIIAALLHDVIEDTRFSKQELAAEFGDEVAELVDGVSKLTQMELENPANAQAENFRKMMMAMVRDIRVILIKLADRLHNMRTLSVMAPAKRRRIARETLDIFVPIANRLGMNAIRLELEDLGFAALYPMRYRVIQEAVRKARGNRREIMEKIETALKNRLRQEQLNARVVGREKHLYSIYQKMTEKGLSLAEVLDVYAIRIVVDEVETCYRVLGVVHNLYKPLPGRFKDYIAIPKSNGYQSLHTVLFGPPGVPIEVQIRTEEMNKVAEAGVAAHWLYKSSSDPGNSAHARAREWLRSLLEMQRASGDSVEFLENVKIDLFPDEVYVFTPKGEIMELPRGATAVDYAYAVHTDVGNSCAAAKINRRMMPLSTPLENGQTIEVITSPVGRPNPAWLNFVVTAKARTNIRNFLKNLTRQDAIQLGRYLLERALAALGATLKGVPQQGLDALLAELRVASADVLFEQIGLGQRPAALVARRLQPEGASSEAVQPPSRDQAPLAIRGSEGAVVSFAKCCHPIPGDPILGFLTAGRGLVIHRQQCRNVHEFRKKPDKWVNVEWSGEIDGYFATEIHVEIDNQRGVLASVAAAISELDSNIEDVKTKEKDGLHTTIMFVIMVHDRLHLA
ncbi:MAG TPA: bifunctional GTP diphosphokinase/guanosine-3',5'-bis pyrophosphate 3'-pyrophosphohydrolase, partial [Gammaproteobacteria bacterium]